MPPATQIRIKTYKQFPKIIYEVILTYPYKKYIIIVTVKVKKNSSKLALLGMV
jgi:hypothetical protein